MKIRRPLLARKLAFVAAGTLAVLTAVVVPAAAEAAPLTAVLPQSTQVCDDTGTHYSTSNKQDIFIGLGLKYKSGPGGTVHASTQGSLSTSATVSISGGASISAAVASFSTTFGVSATVSSSISSTYAYDHPVAAGKYGTLQFGNWGWKATLKKWVVDSTCHVTSNVTGTLTRVPSVDTWGYKYTETSS